MHYFVDFHVRNIRDIHAVEVDDEEILLGVIGHHTISLYDVHEAVQRVQELLIFEIY